MAMFLTPVSTENVFTMLRWSLPSKIFSTSTLYNTYHILWLLRNSPAYTSTT